MNTWYAPGGSSRYASTITTTGDSRVPNSDSSADRMAAVVATPPTPEWTICMVWRTPLSYQGVCPAVNHPAGRHHAEIVGDRRRHRSDDC